MKKVAKEIFVSFAVVVVMFALLLGVVLYLDRSEAYADGCYVETSETQPNGARYIWVEYDTE